MILTKNVRDQVVGIEFCCARVKEYLSGGYLLTGPWTDYGIRATIRKAYGVDCCPWCRAEIKVADMFRDMEGVSQVTP